MIERIAGAGSISQVIKDCPWRPPERREERDQQRFIRQAWRLHERWQAWHPCYHWNSRERFILFEENIRGREEPECCLLLPNGSADISILLDPETDFMGGGAA